MAGEIRAMKVCRLFFGILRAIWSEWVRRGSWLFRLSGALCFFLSSGNLSAAPVNGNGLPRDPSRAAIGRPGAHRTSDLARSNAELSREQALLRALLDNSPDEIYFKDSASRYLKASNAQAVNFGLLNSVNVSATVIETEVRHSRISNVTRISELLRAPLATGDLSDGINSRQRPGNQISTTIDPVSTDYP